VGELSLEGEFLDKPLGPVAEALGNDNFLTEEKIQNCQEIYDM
jgi:hypothetical protein